ncbi:unnamed protein product [Vitrella brassicaformis CCMP3155]|uniref:SKP1 component POZ domain-containing protein n=1 Tax=Vitrella brassicaformis (strain CCMP3155) TaxID=1169540 RepID=A0A0G4GTY8_VITBC|nr:unnamed protein product [Vitrella brassicaformis CCMP3155]|eukprot:CEM34191.1 unnamed protein product [Vitrella brassicaformis CCMP3155]
MAEQSVTVALDEKRKRLAVIEKLLPALHDKPTDLNAQRDKAGKEDIESIDGKIASTTEQINKNTAAKGELIAGIESLQRIVGSGGVMIKVQSADGELVEIPLEAARRSNVVKGILEAASDQTQISLHVDAHLLNMVFHKYCGHYGGREIPAIKQPLQSTDHIGEVLLVEREVLGTADRQELYQVMKAADFLDLQSLLQLTYAAYACHIRDMSPQEIKDTFEPLAARMGADLEADSDSECESESESVEGDSSGEEGRDENGDGEGDENAAVAMSTPTATALGDADDDEWSESDEDDSEWCASDDDGDSDLSSGSSLDSDPDRQFGEFKTEDVPHLCGIFPYLPMWCVRALPEELVEAVTPHYRHVLIDTSEFKEDMLILADLAATREWGSRLTNLTTLTVRHRSVSDSPSTVAPPPTFYESLKCLLAGHVEGRKKMIDTMRREATGSGRGPPSAELLPHGSLTTILTSIDGYVPPSGRPTGPSRPLPCLHALTSIINLPPGAIGLGDCFQLPALESLTLASDDLRLLQTAVMKFYRHSARTPTHLPGEATPEEKTAMFRALAAHWPGEGGQSGRLLKFSRLASIGTVRLERGPLESRDAILELRDVLARYGCVASLEHLSIGLPGDSIVDATWLPVFSALESFHSALCRPAVSVQITHFSNARGLIIDLGSLLPSMQRHSSYATPFVMECVQKTACLATDLDWTIAAADLVQPPAYDAAIRDFVAGLLFQCACRVTVCNADGLAPPADAQGCNASILANLSRDCFPHSDYKLTLSSRLGCRIACQLASRLKCTELICRGVTVGQALQVI